MSTKKIPESLQSMLDVYQQPFVLVDRHFTIVASNQAYADQYNLTPDDIVGCKCHKVSHNSDKPCAEVGEDCPHRRMFKSGQVEVKQRAESGSVGVPIRDASAIIRQKVKDLYDSFI